MFNLLYQYSSRNSFIIEHDNVWLSIGAGHGCQEALISAGLSGYAVCQQPVVTPAVIDCLPALLTTIKNIFYIFINPDTSSVRYFPIGNAESISCHAPAAGIAPTRRAGRQWPGSKAPAGGCNTRRLIGSRSRRYEVYGTSNSKASGGNGPGLRGEAIGQRPTSAERRWVLDPRPAASPAPSRPSLGAAAVPLRGQSRRSAQFAPRPGSPRAVLRSLRAGRAATGYRTAEPRWNSAWKQAAGLETPAENACP